MLTTTRDRNNFRQVSKVMEQECQMILQKI